MRMGNLLKFMLVAVALVTHFGSDGPQVVGGTAERGQSFLSFDFFLFFG
jgi:hypothetical protein